MDNAIKVQRASPSPDVRVRAFRLHQSPDTFETQNSSPTLNVSGSPGFSTEQSKLLRQSSYSSNLSNGAPSRRREVSERLADAQNENQESTDHQSSPLLNTKDGSEPWSSAVGRATVSGKSGRVIERLQADNDRLRREIKLFATKADEEQRRGELMKSELDSLRASNQNLEAICNANRTTFVRKDRKIEELRNELKHEKLKREAAQSAETDAIRQSTQALARARGEVSREKEIAAAASTQYDVLRASLERLRNEYQRKIDLASLDMKALLRRIELDDDRFSNLEMISQQLEHDHERLSRANKDLTTCYQTYKQTSDETLSIFKLKLNLAGQESERIHQEMIATTGRMRQAMRLKKDLKANSNE